MSAAEDVDGDSEARILNKIRITIKIKMNALTAVMVCLL